MQEGGSDVTYLQVVALEPRVQNSDKEKEFHGKRSLVQFPQSPTLLVLSRHLKKQTNKQTNKQTKKKKKKKKRPTLTVAVNAVDILAPLVSVCLSVSFFPFFFFSLFFCLFFLSLFVFCFCKESTINLRRSKTYLKPPTSKDFPWAWLQVRVKNVYLMASLNLASSLLQVRQLVFPFFHAFVNELGHKIQRHTKQEDGHKDHQLGIDAEELGISEGQHETQRFPQTIVREGGFLVVWEEDSIQS